MQSRKRGQEAGVDSSEEGYKISKTSHETTSRSVGSDGLPHLTPGLPSVLKNAASSSRSHTGDPPALKKVLPSRADVRAPTKPREKANLPVDVLLLTAEECGFLACYSELKDPYKCYFVELGYVYFSDVGDSQQEVKVALLSCYKNDSGPGGSLITVKNAASVLRPKAVIYMGTCKGLISAKSKLGDVVVSAKLATHDQEQSTNMKVHVSKRFLNLIKNCADGWQAPLKHPAEARQVQVYTDAEFLTGPEQVCAEWWRDQLAKTNLGEMAIETGGRGVFTGAFDCEIEWLIVKGIADYADGDLLASESWSSFASAVAASVVAHILSEPSVFQSWHHYEDSSDQGSVSKSKGPLPFPSDVSTTFLEWSQKQLCTFYNSAASQVMITPWDPTDTVDIDEVYVQLTLLKDDRKLSGTTKIKLADYSEVFASHGYHVIPTRILVYGRPGIGKSTFTKKLAVDWSRGNQEVLKKFDVVLSIKLRDVCNTPDFCDMLEKAELLSADNPMVFRELYDYLLRNQQKVLLVLDGYDEYSAEKSSPVHQIWKGNLLRDCIVLVTTRPRSKDELRPESHAQFEVSGFDRRQVEKFAVNFLHDEEVVNKFTDFLFEHDLWDLAEIPLLLLMLVLIWKNNDYQASSPSRTHLYNSFCHTLRDHVIAKTPEETFKSKDEYEEDLAKLGELAWDALLTDCLNFNLGNLPDDIRLLVEKFIDFGFLQISNLSSSPRPEKRVFFLHKSIQEFLSALFIVQNLRIAKDTLTCLTKVDSVEKLQKLFEVFLFVFELSSEAAGAVFRHLKMIGEKEGVTDFAFCEYTFPSYECLTKEQIEFCRVNLDCFLSCPASKREAVYSSFLQSVNGVMVIDRKYQVPTLVKDHCLRSPAFLKPDYVFFYNEFFDDEEIFQLLHDLETFFVTCYGDTKSIDGYRHLFSWQGTFVKKVGRKMVLHLTNPKFELVSALISASPETRHTAESPLDLIDRTLTHSLSFLRKIELGSSTSELCSVLKNLHHVPRLIELVLCSDGMANQECHLLASALKYVGKLRTLNLSCNPLGDGICELAKHLNSVPHLEELYLNSTKMGQEEVATVAYNLQYVTQLKILNLSCNPLGYGISELAKHVHSVPHLEKLYLNSTKMGQEEVTTVAHNLQYVTHLKILKLSSNPLGYGISELAKHLNSVPHLEELYLDFTKMGQEGITTVAHNLQYVTQLKILELSSNPLGYGISELAKHLNSVPHLEELHLVNTCMGKKEVAALAPSLVCVPELKCLSLDRNPLGRGVSELIKHFSSIPRRCKLFLRDVEMTKEEATELCTLADGSQIWLESRYHVIDRELLRKRYCLVTKTELTTKGS